MATGLLARPGGGVSYDDPGGKGPPGVAAVRAPGSWAVLITIKSAPKTPETIPAPAAGALLPRAHADKRFPGGRQREGAAMRTQRGAS